MRFFMKNCHELIQVVLFMMEKQQQMRRSLQRLQDSASALENRNMASRYRKVYGTASSCMSLPRYLRRRMGRTGSDV